MQQHALAQFEVVESDGRIHIWKPIDVVIYVFLALYELLGLKTMVFNQLQVALQVGELLWLSHYQGWLEVHSCCISYPIGRRPDLWRDCRRVA